MGFVNTALNGFFDLLIQPFRAIHPLLGLVSVSAVMAIIALLAFRYGSNADAITRIKTRIGGYLLEMRIFKDDLKILLVDPWKILGWNARYVMHALGPFVLILPIMVLAIIHIESRYSVRALEPGETVNMTVRLAEGQSVTAPIELETSPGIVVETPPVRIREQQRVLWRLRGADAGEQWVRVRIGDGEPVETPVWVGEEPHSLSRARTARYAGFAALGEPAAKPLPASSGIVELRIPYPDGEAKPGGLSTSVWIFFGLSTVLGFALKDVLGVTL